MSDASTPPNNPPPPTPGGTSIAQQLCRRYSITMSDDLADWFDSKIWQRPCGAEYGSPVDPQVLLDSTPEVIWPALMPPDFLPLIGNMAGDWLCVRVDNESHASSIVQWYHGGGDWISWGDSIASAIAFDHLQPRLPGPGRRHSIPAEEPRGKSASESAGSITSPSSAASWAINHLPSGVTEAFSKSIAPRDMADLMIQHGVAEVAVRCELVQAALAENRVTELTPDNARQLGVDWNDAVEWMFDADRIPDTMRQRLIDQLSVPLPTSPNIENWQTVAMHSRAVTEVAPDHAWAWDILGYTAERSGDHHAAIQAYRRALHCSVFTDQSVRLRTHWTSPVAAKFSAARLSKLTPHLSANGGENENNYEQLLCETDSKARRQLLTSYWCRIADAQLLNNNYIEAYRCFVAAGWDLGADPIHRYGQLLESVTAAATHCGWAGRAAVAKTHRACLHQRYGV